MSATKLVTLHGCMIREETTYGTLPSFSVSTDGVQTTEKVVPEYAYATDGARPAAPGSLGPQVRARPTGRTASATVVCEAKGAGAAYTALVTPPNIHALLRACGLSSTFATATWTYAPQNQLSGWTSVALQSFHRGELHTLRGGYGTFDLNIPNAGVPTFSFALQGLGNTPSDDVATLGTITYAATAVNPPVAENVTLSLGSYTAAIARNLSFTLGREIAPRTAITGAGGHAGFAPGRIGPRFRCQVEASALVAAPFHTTGGVNPFELAQPTIAGATPAQIALGLTVGGTANNRFTLSVPNAQLVSAAPAEDGPVALWDLEFEVNGGTFSLLFN